MADRLLLLIPGFQFTFQRNATLDLLKNEMAALISTVHPPGSLTTSTRGGLSGYSVTLNGKTTEMYEVSWQDRVVLLNQKKLLQRLLAGFFASISWIFSRRVWAALATNRAWLMWFVVSAALMALWFYGIIAVALVAAGALQTPVSLPASVANWLSTARKDSVGFGTTMQGWWVWVFLTGALAAAGIRPDFIADLADLMQRYLSDSKDDDPAQIRTLAEIFRGLMYDAVATVPSKDDPEILLVGHSFGALLAVDAMANDLPNRVSLMTLGGIIQFLMARKPELKGVVDNCAASPSLVKWDDYSSDEDWFGSLAPLSTSPEAYSIHDVTMRVPFYKRFTLEAHRGYYRDKGILSSMLAQLPLGKSKEVQSTDSKQVQTGEGEPVL